MTILPVGLEFKQWVDALRNEYPDADLPLFVDENNWKQWAESLIIIPTFNNVALPDPRGFNNWQEYAVRFTEIIGA